MTLRVYGALAALICAATYIAGFVLMIMHLAPMGYGTSAMDVTAIVAFIAERPGLMGVWNLLIYVVNALALLLLVSALSRHVLADWSVTVLAFGIVWATLVLGAGMVANVAVERVVALYATDPIRAAHLWEMLHMVELGLGGGNEIAGGIWIGLVGLAGWVTATLWRWVCLLALIVGISGLATLWSPIGDIAGAVFGLGAIAWFGAVGLNLLRER